MPPPSKASSSLSVNSCTPQPHRLTPPHRSALLFWFSLRPFPGLSPFTPSYSTTSPPKPAALPVLQFYILTSLNLSETASWPASAKGRSGCFSRQTSYHVVLTSVV